MCEAPLEVSKIQTWSSDYDNTLSAFQVMPIQIQMSISRISMHITHADSNHEFNMNDCEYHEMIIHITYSERIGSNLYVYIYTVNVFSHGTGLHGNSCIPCTNLYQHGSQGVPNLRNCKWISSYQHPKVKINKLPSRELGLRYPTLGRLEHHRLKSTDMVFRICSVSGHLNSFDSCQKKKSTSPTGENPTDWAFCSRPCYLGSKKRLNGEANVRFQLQNPSQWGAFF